MNAVKKAKPYKPSKGLFAWSPDYTKGCRARIASRAETFKRDQARLDQAWGWMLSHPERLGSAWKLRSVAEGIGVSLGQLEKSLYRARTSGVKLRANAVAAYVREWEAGGLGGLDAWNVLGFNTRGDMADYTRYQGIPVSASKLKETALPVSVRNRMNTAAMRYMDEVVNMVREFEGDAR